MRVPRFRLAALALVSGLALGGCAYGLGDPYGSYGGVSVGYGNGYGYGSPYGGYGYGSPYGGYGYGSPYGGYGNYLGYGYGGYPYGWYNGYYYPGSGYYVYDRDRHRRQITDAERQYWRQKFDRMRSGTTSGTTATTSSIAPRENWSGFKRVRVRSSDSDRSSRFDRGYSRSGSSSSRSSSSSSSSSSNSRSSDFMGRHSPHRSKD